MNKRALLGTIVLITIAVIVLGGMFGYYQFKKHGVQIKSGNIEINLKYNASDSQNENTPEIDIKEITEEGNLVYSPPNSTAQNETVQNKTNLTTLEKNSS